MEVDKAAINTQNEAQWKEIEYLLSAKRTRPALLWITTNTTYFLRKYYKKCKKAFPQYKHIEIDISERKIISLNQTLQELLPEEVKKSPEIQHIVHIFGLENSASPLGVTPAIREINHEREMLFREYNCVIMVWSDEILTKKVKEYAPDFWNWASDNFFFEDASFKPKVEEKPIWVTFLYVEEDSDFKRELEEELFRNQGIESKLKFRFVNLSNDFTIYKDNNIIIPILNAKSLELSRNYILAHNYVDNIVKKRQKNYFNRNWLKIYSSKLNNNLPFIICAILSNKCNWENSYFKKFQILPEDKVPIKEINYWDKPKTITKTSKYILDFEESINYKMIKEQEYRIFKKIEDLALILFPIMAIMSCIPFIYLLFNGKWFFLLIFIILNAIIFNGSFSFYTVFFVFAGLDRILNNSPQKSLWELFQKNKSIKNWSKNLQKRGNQ